jgi:hypothetical protein
VTAIGPVLRQAADDAADGADAKLVSAARAKREKSQAEEFARLMPLIRRYARLHATAVAAIIISGDPKIDEPLVGVKDSKRWPRLPLGTMAAGDPVRTPAEEFESDLSPEEQRFYQKMKEKPGRRVVPP